MRVFKDIISLLRIKHWVKNVFVFAPLLFSWQITDITAVIRTLLAFLAFSLVASTIYIINDIYDVEADKQHPKKCKRPIPAGRIGIKTAVVMAVFCILAGLGLSWLPGLLFGNWLTGLLFFCCTTSYLVLNIFYTLKGKHIVIVDAFCIAIGFVLRVIGGAFAIEVAPSGWIIMTTFFLCLFMGFGKRRNELLSLKAQSGSHRSVLGLYTDSMLNQFILSSATISIISYTLYTLSESVKSQFNTGDKLVVTVPIVTFVIFRYTYLIWSREEGDPTDVLLKDPGLLLSGFAWLVVTVGMIFFCLNFLPAGG